MKVSDRAVSSMRAYLRVDMAEYRRLGSELSAEERDARGALIAAAFSVMADRSFSGSSDAKSEIVEFVSALRSRGDEMATLLDPNVSQRLLLAVVSDEDVDDIRDETKGEHFAPLLVGMVVDAKLDDADLDAMLSEAREIADGWLAED